MIQVNNLPAELRENGLFCCWRYEKRGKGKPTKVPYNPRTDGKAQSTNPDTFALLPVTLEALYGTTVNELLREDNTGADSNKN